MPYAYYQIFRVIASVLFGYLSIKSGNDSWMITWGISAILVQPFFKIPLGREIWNIIDVLFAIMLLFSLTKVKNKS
jgi:hypothetical protein